MPSFRGGSWRDETGAANAGGSVHGSSWYLVVDSGTRPSNPATFPFDMYCVVLYCIDNQYDYFSIIPL